MDKCTMGSQNTDCGKPSAMFVRNLRTAQDYHFCRECATDSLMSEWQMRSPHLTMHIENRLILSDTTLIVQSYFDYWGSLD